MDLEKLWRTCLAEIELSVTKATYQTHFKNSRLVSLEKDVAKIGFPSGLSRAIVETRYYALIKNILDEHNKNNNSLVFSVISRTPPLSEKDAGPLFSQTIEQSAPSTDVFAKRLHIRPESTFDNFAVSTTNQIAYAAATAVAHNPGSAYNPLFIYGGVGVGKTHLMHAVANSLLVKKPSMKVVYCMGEEFLNEIVEAIQTKTARVFKQKYRSAELLMVDDVQFIAGKNTAQEEFFHTFNAVHREGGQIILTSDRPPSEISKLEDRLRSRFEGGLTVDISPPDFELRAAIVNIKAKALLLNVPADAGRLIAANITDTRALEGFLRRLTTTAEPITPERITSMLGSKTNGQGTQKPTRRASPQEVLEAVASYYGLKTSTLKGQKRDRPIARPRQIIMYLCKTEVGLTLNDIGGVLGGRDHTTVMHGVDTITRELSTNARLREDIEGIKQKIWA